MKLVRGAWKLLVGVKDALVLVFMLLFFGIIFAALAARPAATQIGEGALLLDLSGSIVEQPAPVPAAAALSGASRQTRQLRLRDLIAATNAAATDSRVKAVVVDLDGFLGAGQVALTDLGAALDRVRAVKKPVLAFATGYSDDSYQLAAHASEIWLDPMGLALLPGPGGSRLYYKGLIDKVGANVHVYRVGEFKSAVEPYSRADQSEPAKAANVALASALWQNWLGEIAKARPQAQIAAYAADPVKATANGDLAQAALAARIVDKLGEKDEFDRHVASIVGAGTRTTPYARIAMRPWIAANPPKAGDGKIGVITVAGTIVDGEADAGTAAGDTISKLINRAVNSGRFQALVVRVDSPGGSALASEKIRSALANAKARGLPIVVSMSNVAASGGYWVSTIGDKVFAEPGTITGSIGVFGIIPTFEATLKKAGVTTDGVTTTPLSGQPDIFGGTNAAFDTIIQKSIESTYGRFIQLVSGARKIAPARVNEIAQGRVWDGGSARQLGLVDAFGGLDDAIAEAARRAKLDPAAPHAVWIEKAPRWTDALAASFMNRDNDDEAAPATDLVATLARVRTFELAAAVDDLQRLAGGSSIQARCFECPITATTASPRALSLLELLQTWIAR